MKATRPPRLGAVLAGLVAASLSLVVVSAPGRATTPPVAMLSYPINGAQNVDTTKPFTWAGVAGAESYRLTVGSDQGLADLADSHEVSATSYLVPPLPGGRSLWARLSTKRAGAWTASPDVSFTTPAPPSPPTTTTTTTTSTSTTTTPPPTTTTPSSTTTTTRPTTSKSPTTTTSNAPSDPGSHDGSRHAGTSSSTVPSPSGSAVSSADRRLRPVQAVSVALLPAAGTLSVTPPTSLGVIATVSGFDQSVLASGSPNSVVEVSDGRPPGQQVGWHVTMVTTQFTSGSNTLPTTALTMNGSSGSATSAAAPAASCVGTCTLPAGNTVTYPVTISTSGAVSIFAAATHTGTGTVDLATAFWLKILANTAAGNYTATATIAVTSGP